MLRTYPRTAVVIPIRGFTDGKTRLSPRLSRPQRAHLVEEMATRVVRACDDLPVVIVSSAPEVGAWARSLGLGVLDDPGSLDEAAALGVRWARSQMYSRVVIAHADLPRARTLRPVLTSYTDEGLIAVIGHRDGGSPVLSIPTTTGFTFAYGPGSLRRHIHEALRLHLPVRLLQDDELGFDLDTPDDLLHLDPPPPAPAPAALSPVAATATP